MELKPIYSYEFNCILNLQLNQNEQIKNFASLITDKDRFLCLLPLIKNNFKLIEKKLGYKLLDLYEFYIVRSEKFESFSTPITIEYNLNPYQMLLFLLKEIIKISIKDRFDDYKKQEEYINSFIKHIVEKLNDNNLKKSINCLENASLKKFKDYKQKDLDFENKTLKEHIFEIFN